MSLRRCWSPKPNRSSIRDEGQESPAVPEQPRKDEDDLLLKKAIEVSNQRKAGSRRSGSGEAGQRVSSAQSADE